MVELSGVKGVPSNPVLLTTAHTAVPPAVASIASLAQLRCLELYGSSIDRILDPPYRLLGLTALRNLTRLRIDLPDESADGQFPGGGGNAAAVAAAEVGGCDAALRRTFEGPVATAGAGAVGSGTWRLGPTLAALTWLQDLDLGASYAVPPEALPFVAGLTQLRHLRCGTLLTPALQHRFQRRILAGGQNALPLPLPLPLPGGESHRAPTEIWSGMLQLPLPSSLQHIQVLYCLAALLTVSRITTNHFTAHMLILVCKMLDVDLAGCCDGCVRSRTVYPLGLFRASFCCTFRRTGFSTAGCARPGGPGSTSSSACAHCHSPD